MFILYTVAPLLYRMASSAYYNLSLLSSDFYGLLFGLFLFVRIPSRSIHANFAYFLSGTQGYHPYWLYFIAFAVVISGLVVYFWSATRKFLHLHLFTTLFFLLSRCIQLKSKESSIPERRPTSTSVGMPILNQQGKECPTSATVHKIWSVSSSRKKM